MGEAIVRDGNPKGYLAFVTVWSMDVKVPSALTGVG
jgi:hypothetical protein